MTASTMRSSLAGAIGLGVTIAAAVAPSAVLDHRDPVSRAVLETAVALVGTLVAVLAFGRFRRSRSIGDLSIVYAVALLASVHTLFGTVPDMISPYSVGNGVSERFEVWGTIVVRTLAAGFLVAAALAHRPGRTRGTTAKFLHPAFLASVIAGALSIVLLGLFAPIGRNGLVHQISWPPSLSAVLQLLGATLYFAAFIALSKRASARSDPFLGWIAAGCVFGGFAAISYALLPTGGPDWLRPGDLLRAAAVGTWAMGAVAEIRAYWSKIADSARREARRAVALDLHDGLAQELALLTTYTYAPAQARAEPQWHEQLQVTAERALAEARRAITALAADEFVPFETDLEQTAESISGKGVHVRVAVDPGVAAEATDPLQRESIVRIVREAVTNAVRHGGASHIDILFETNGSPALRVFDDGVGFVPTDAAHSGRFGLIGMRERAEAIGASLAVQSAPGQGTTVEVRWP
jgi:signal transduction histidine kinase